MYKCLVHLLYISSDFSSGRVIDWSIDFLKTASGASEVYSVDYTSALLEEGGKLLEKVGRDFHKPGPAFIKLFHAELNLS